MHVVVTGATGCLGGRLARHLAARGDTVVGLGRDEAAGALLTRDGVRFRPADLTSLAPADWDRLLDGAAAVVHAAALSTLWAREADYLRTNVLASGAAAAAARRAGARFVHISSPSIYNGTGLTTGIREDTAVGPRFDSPYARSKYRSEQAVAAEHPAALVLRPRGIYGPGDTAIVPRIVTGLRRGRLPRLVRGEVPTELTHVDNVVHAIALGLSGDASGPVNVTDGEPTPIWATIDRVADAIGVARPTRHVPGAVVERAAWLLERAALVNPRRPEPTLTASGVRLLTTPMSLDLTRARDLLSYAPVVRAADGIDDMIAGLR